MKKMIFALLFFLSGSGAFAQHFTDQGNFLMGTAVGFSSNNSKLSYSATTPGATNEGPYSLQWNVAPHIGYFLTRNFTLGIGLDYTFSREQQPSADKTEDSDLLFGPFTRVYLPFGDKAFLLEGNFGFGHTSDILNIAGSPQSISTNIMAVGVGPGFTIFSTSAVGLEFLVKYNYSRSRFDTEISGVKTRTTSETNQIAISLGIEWYFSGVQRAR